MLFEKVPKRWVLGNEEGEGKKRDSDDCKQVQGNIQLWKQESKNLIQVESTLEKIKEHTIKKIWLFKGDK